MNFQRPGSPNFSKFTFHPNYAEQKQEKDPRRDENLQFHRRSCNEGTLGKCLSLLLSVNGMKLDRVKSSAEWNEIKQKIQRDEKRKIPND